MTNAQNLHALLDQTGWIHALAQRLVADPHLAADLAQETTIDALEREPDGRSSLRGWLATVMRNNLAKLRRGERNRSARERADARGTVLEPSAHDVVERAETHRNVVLSVLALDEPYRSTLLMRFFEQLSYDEIARRTGVTSAAVNSRVTRGLEQLRARLENTYGGDRRALGLALTPLAKLPTSVAVPFLGAKMMYAAIGTLAVTLVAVTATVSLTGGERGTKTPTSPRDGASEETSPETVLTPATAFFDHGPREANLPAPEQREEQRQQKQQDDANVWKTELFSARLLPATVQKLAVNSGAGNIEVIASNSNQLEITAKVRAKLDTVEARALTQVFEDHVDVSEEDGLLKIEDKHHNERGWSVSFVVGVPGKLPLSANSGSGDVIVRQARSEVTANTGSGDVKVALAGERVEMLLANTGSGDVEVEVGSIEGMLDANTGSGNVRMHVADPSSPGKASLSSGSGDLFLVVPANVVGSFAMRTNGDGIDVPPGLGFEVKKESDGFKARGVLGSGGGSYTLSSGSGQLKLALGNALPAKPK
ncbi:MAG: sigma-70 family RNA polymerase sigma factor [Planctomycetes bacterium]|nr:sigma-70 family RNA polymerase sigma factor [Planctomycetota bacterium]